MKLLIEVELNLAGETFEGDGTWAVNKALDTGALQDAIRDVSATSYGGAVSVASVIVRYDDPDEELAEARTVYTSLETALNELVTEFRKEALGTADPESAAYQECADRLAAVVDDALINPEREIGT
jgi:hypothetical protein